MATILQPGTLVDNRYRVVRLIGQGGFGAVYEAEDTRFRNSIVAIKQMFLNTHLPPPTIAQFEHAFKREAETLHHLHHACLPHVSDYFLDANGHFLVMKYIQGNDLADWLTQRMQTPGKPFTGDDRDGSYFVSLHPHLFMDALVVWHRKPATTIPHTVFTFNE